MSTTKTKQPKTTDTAPFPKCYKTSSKPHNFCPGCGHPIVLNELGFAIDNLKIQNSTAFLIDIGCSLLAWDYFDVDTSQTHHGRTIPVATGFKRGKPDASVIAYLGDGGGYAIGMQHLIHATLRNDDITVIIVNNLNYAMTGGQMAPTTLEKQPPTTTAPFDRTEEEYGQHLSAPEMLSTIAAEGAFIARMSVDNPIQLRQAFEKALTHQKEKKGFSFIEVLSYCPINWKTNAKETLSWLTKIKKDYPIFAKTIGKETNEE